MDPQQRGMLESVYRALENGQSVAKHLNGWILTRSQLAFPSQRPRVPRPASMSVALPTIIMT